MCTCKEKFITHYKLSATFVEKRADIDQIMNKREESLIFICNGLNFFFEETIYMFCVIVISLHPPKNSN